MRTCLCTKDSQRGNVKRVRMHAYVYKLNVHHCIYGRPCDCIILTFSSCDEVDEG